MTERTKEEYLLETLMDARNILKGLKDRESVMDIGELVLGDDGDLIWDALDRAIAYTESNCSESAVGDIGGLPKELLSSHVGFNTKVIKRGAVFYMKLENRELPLVGKLSPHRMKYEGNAMITQGTPTYFEFQMVNEITDRMVRNISVYDLLSGAITILEMRELK